MHVYDAKVIHGFGIFKTMQELWKRSYHSEEVLRFDDSRFGVTFSWFKDGETGDDTNFDYRISNSNCIFADTDLYRSNFKEQIRRTKMIYIVSNCVTTIKRSNYGHI